MLRPHPRLTRRRRPHASWPSQIPQIPPEPRPLRLGLSHRTTLPPEQCPYHQTQLSGQLSLACSRGLGVSAQHKQATSRQRLQVPRREVPQAPAYPVPHHRRTDGAAHDEANPRRLLDIPDQQVADEHGPPRPAATGDGEAEIRPAAHPRGCGQHLVSRQRGRLRESDADPATALAPPGGQDRTPGPGAHAQPEAVRLRATAVVRLKRALAHGNSRYRSRKSSKRQPRVAAP